MGNPDQQRNKRSAFAFTELLTVVAIIGILAALILSAISRVKARTQRIQCSHNLGQMSLALQLFLNDNHVYPLVSKPVYDSTYPENYGAWFTTLGYTYLSIGPMHTRIEWEKSILCCPAARRPSTFTETMGYGLYAYNAYGMSAMKDTNSLGIGGHFVWKSPNELPAPPVTESEVVNPSAMLAIGDGFIGGNGVIQDNRTTLGRTYGLTNFYGNSTQRSYARHQGVANVVFCDGHLESPKLKSLFDDTSDASLIWWNRDHLPHREKLTP